MKKLISFLLVCFAFVAVNAQSTSPRFGTAKNDDNTGRVLTYRYVTLTDATGADSVSLYPSAYSNTYRVALTDSLFIKGPTVTASYASDHITFVASGSSGSKLKFDTANFISAGAATLSTSGRAVINFIFDGVKWVEYSRVLQ